MSGTTFAGINWLLIGSTPAEVRLAKSDNATVVRRFSKRRSKHALNSIHKSCKLQNNWFKCHGLRKRHKNTDSPICQTLFPPWRACALQRQFRDREWQKSLLTSHIWGVITAEMRCCIMLFYYHLLDSAISVTSSLSGIVNSIRPFCILLCIYTFDYVL